MDAPFQRQLMLITVPLYPPSLSSCFSFFHISLLWLDTASISSTVWPQRLVLYLCLPPKCSVSSAATLGFNRFLHRHKFFRYEQMSVHRFLFKNSHVYTCIHIHASVCIYMYLYIYVYTHLRSFLSYFLKRIRIQNLSMVVHNYIVSALWEAKESRSLWVLGLPGLYSMFQANQNYSVRCCLISEKKKNNAYLGFSRTGPLLRCCVMAVQCS